MNKIKLHGFNNLTKTLSFNIYDICYAKTEAQQKEYIAYIDEAYNANPASMRAALALLAQTKPGGKGRRIAVLGDMLELGENGPTLHEELRGPIDEADVNAVYACGPLMAHLWEGLPAGRRGAYAETSEGLNEAVLQDLRDGDVVMVKGSLGSKMIPIVDALKRRYPEREAT